MWNAFNGSKSRIPVNVGGREREGRCVGMGDGTARMILRVGMGCASKVASVLLADGLRMGPMGAGETLPLNCRLLNAVTGILDHLCSPMASSSSVALETVLWTSSRTEWGCSISGSEEGRLRKVSRA